MDRPKHRRLLLLALALLAGGALLLLGRQWMSRPDRIIVQVEPTPRPPVEPQPDKTEPATVATTAPSAAAPQPPPPAPATGFRGRVIDAVTRQPVKEFEVQLIRIERHEFGTNWLEPITRTFKSASGRFAWTDAAAGTWRAAISAHGYQTFNVPEFRIDRSKTTRDTVMPLLRGYAVRGRVFDLSTGTGIADASITFRPTSESDPGSRPRAVAKSQGDGSFTLDGVSAGDIRLFVSASDHEEREIVIVVDEKTPPQEIALSTGGTIAGTVTTTSGAPVTGHVMLNGPGYAAYPAETNEAGQFSYKHLAAGPYRISVDASAGSTRQEFVLQQDELKDIVLIVGAGRSIRGMVRGPRPEQIQKTELRLRTESGNAFMSSHPDERGAYAFNGVPPGPAVIAVYSPDIQFQKRVSVRADQDVALDIVLSTGSRLSGRVTQGGKPAAHKSVGMGPDDSASDMFYRTITAEDGRYEIEGLPPGDYRLRAEGDVSRAITIAGDAVLNIDIPSVQLSARVVEDGGSVPIVGADVYVRGTAAETARVRVDKQTDDFGQIALTGIEPGEIVLMVYKAGYEMHREKIVYSSPITNRTITLRKSAGVEVRVKPGSRRFTIGFTITQTFADPDYLVDIWIPLDGDRVGHVPSALAGTTFQIGRFSGKPLDFEDWDGQPFELQ